MGRKWPFFRLEAFFSQFLVQKLRERLQRRRNLPWPYPDDFVVRPVPGLFDWQGVTPAPAGNALQIHEAFFVYLPKKSQCQVNRLGARDATAARALRGERPCVQRLRRCA